MSERVQRRLAVIWNADAVGYSRLMSADDAGTFDELRIRREILRDRIARHGGRTVDAVGDDFLAEFPSAVAAVECAVAVQGELATRDAGLAESRRLPFRVGIQLGEVLVDGAAVAGDAVNVAARIRALAEPGQVFVTAAVHDQVRGKLARGFEDRGEHQLKNIPQKVRVYRVMSESQPSAEPTVTPSVSPRPGIAVLPFQNLSSDPEQEYLADGIAEDLLTRMARWQLPVVSRQSSFAYRGRQVDVRQIGRELGARYLLEGSLRRAGNRLRVTAQLIDTETGAHVWAQSFDREFGELFALQEEIARAIELSMGTRIARLEEQRALGATSESVTVWDRFMLAQWHNNRSTPEDWREARRLLREAVALEPQFADAQGFLAVVEYTGLLHDWCGDPSESLEVAQAAARRSFALAPNSRFSQTAAALSAMRIGDFASARAAFERVLQLEPGNFYAQVSLAWFLNVEGRYADAEECAKAALADTRDPGIDDGGAWFPLAWAHMGFGRDAEALRCARLSLQSRDGPFAHGIVIASLAHLGRLDEAKREVSLVPDLRRSDFARALQQQVQPALLERSLEGLRLAGMPE